VRADLDGVIDEEAIRRRFELAGPALDERARRRFAGAEAIAAGRGGVASVSRATGMCRDAVLRGARECGTPDEVPHVRVRRPGAGRKRATEKDCGLLPTLEALVEPSARGDPESPLRWTVKSTRTLSAELKAQGHEASNRMVWALLHENGYSLQANRKTNEGIAEHPDRNAQFEHINGEVTQRLAAGEPVISVDTKKKELVGDFKNAGQAWLPEGKPEKVLVHDFPDRGVGKAAPYGVYDLAMNDAWVSVGVSADTAQFSVASIRHWWEELGRSAYPQARSLLITADCGGSNGARVRLWKWELQQLASDTGLSITVNHFPPGTSKWNKIEHRLFSFITKNWRGQPLVSYAVIVSLIAATKTSTGLNVRCALDPNQYEKGLRVSNSQMKTLRIARDVFHGEWNYTLHPNVAN